MPKKKRQFLNKKTALKFEIVSRALNDATLVAGEGSEHILRPMNEAAAGVCACACVRVCVCARVRVCGAVGVAVWRWQGAAQHATRATLPRCTLRMTHSRAH